MNGRFVIPFLMGCIIGAAGIVYTLEEKPLWMEEPVAAFNEMLGFSSSTGQFGNGRLLVTLGQYPDGIRLLEEYLELRPLGRNAGRARFFLGKAYIGLGMYDRAAEQFNMVIRDYPGTDEVHKSQYKLAMIDLWQDRKDEARRGFNQLAANPAGPLAPEAEAMNRWLAQAEAN